jgi:purine-cytosine permease-like protein
VVTFTRAVFGVQGNRVNAFLAWVSSVAFEAINTIFGAFALLALFRHLGWTEPGTAGKVLAVIAQLALSGGIAVLGHATMLYQQRIFAVLLTVALLLVFAFSVGGVQWSHPAELSGGAALAIFTVACAIIASGPISYLYNAPDWVRYLPSRTRARAIILNVTLSGGLPALALCMMGALLASRGDMSDPVAGVEPFVPTWVFLVYIVAAVGGSVANNVVTYYSSGLAMQSVGIPMHRYAATALDTVISTVIVLYVLFVQDFSTALNDFVALMIVWLAPFAGVWLTDGVLRRWHYDPVAVHAVKRHQHSAYWGWNGVNLRGFSALLAGVAACLLTINAPIFQGPISRMLGGADLTWIVGFVVSGLTYFVLSRIAVTADTPMLATAAEN